MPRSAIRRSSAILAVLTLMLLSACNWWTYHGSGQRGGLLPSNTSPRTLTVAWGRTLDGAVYASPIVNNGTIYAATEGGSVYAFNTAGDAEVAYARRRSRAPVPISPPAGPRAATSTRSASPARPSTTRPPGGSSPSPRPW